MTATEIPAHTGSKLTRVLGIATALSVVVFLALALFISPPEVSQRDAVRLFYLHVPSAITAFYVAFGVVAVGSIMFLWKRSAFWDVMAGAAGELGTIFCAITLITGMLWGRPTWGVYWEWDPRLTSTAVSFILFCGYLAVRRLDMDPTVRSQRAAVLGLVAFANTFLVRYSVTFWRSLHQGTTLDPIDTQITGVMRQTFFMGLLTALLVFSWLLVHRFRVAWMEREIDQLGLDDAIAARRAEGDGGGAARRAEGDGGGAARRAEGETLTNQGGA